MSSTALPAEYRTRVSPTRVPIPDISVIPNEGPVEKVRVTPPILCIEMLPPEGCLPRVLLRLSDALRIDGTFPALPS